MKNETDTIPTPTISAFELGNSFAKEVISFAEQQVGGLGLDDNEQIEFWSGFHSGINTVE